MLVDLDAMQREAAAVRWDCSYSEADVREGFVGEEEVTFVDNHTFGPDEVHLLAQELPYQEAIIRMRASEKKKKARLLRLHGRDDLAVILEKPHSRRSNDEQSTLMNELNTLIPLNTSRVAIRDSHLSFAVIALVVGEPLWVAAAAGALVNEPGM